MSKLNHYPRRGCPETADGWLVSGDRTSATPMCEGCAHRVAEDYQRASDHSRRPDSLDGWSFDPGMVVDAYNLVNRIHLERPRAEA